MKKSNTEKEENMELDCGGLEARKGKDDKNKMKY